jgi:hypothetical protein
MKTIVSASLAAAAFLGVVAPITAVAQHYDRGWHGDVRHFDRRGSHHWRSGYWQHGSHAGRQGWWWVIGGIRYYYPQPVYPYPEPYRPPVVVLEQVPAPAPEPAPQTIAPQVWYYCEAAAAYYPYVATCPSGWKTVPAVPQGVTP